MAKYTGYVTIPHGSYAQWKNATNGNGYDFDPQMGYGCQCYDLAVEFWWNVGFPAGYPIITDSSAYTMWDNRRANCSYNGVTYFELVTRATDIKKGDVVVFTFSQANPYGHVGFADTDYDSWQRDPNHPYEFPVLSQNNGGTPDPVGGAYTNVHGYDIRLFLGAFRYTAWIPVPPVSSSRPTTSFKWALYARKLREKRSGL